MKTLKIEIPKGYQVDEEKSTFTNIVFKPIEKKWVDLELPSGTLWCDTNELGYYSWDEMINTFDKENLPKLTDFAELYDYCDWKWDDKKKGMRITGKNGNCIFLPALGYRPLYYDSISNVGDSGFYWSVSPNGNYLYRLYFSYDYVNPSYHNDPERGHSIRCIKRVQ